MLFIACEYVRLLAVLSFIECVCVVHSRVYQRCSLSFASEAPFDILEPAEGAVLKCLALSQLHSSQMYYCNSAMILNGMKCSEIHLGVLNVDKGSVLRSGFTLVTILLV